MKEKGYSFKKMREYVKNSLCQNRIPQTYIVIYELIPVGGYQFSIYANDVRSDIYPWLINVYVDNRYRNMGIIYNIMESGVENSLT